MAWPGQPRADRRRHRRAARPRTAEWVAATDHLRVPAGLGYALANRDSVRAALPGAVRGASPADPRDAVAVLRAGLAAAAPPGSPRTPRIAVLTAGESDNAWFEHRLLADASACRWCAPVTSGRAWTAASRPTSTAGGCRSTCSTGASTTACSAPSGRRSVSRWTLLLTEAVRSGRLGLANVPGNGVADDTATYAWVPAMIRFYLGEEPLLASVPTWVLADADQWAQVRDRLHELVLKPVAGYGGRGTVFGPSCSAAELAALQAEVAAAPHRFVAQEPVAASTVPTLVDGTLQPRRVDLRVFSVAGRDGTARALRAPLTRVALGAVAGRGPGHQGHLAARLIRFRPRRPTGPRSACC